MRVKCYVTEGIFGKVVKGVKVRCFKAATKLVVELHTCFSHHEALGIMYPHY
jgi:hypothetical protein